MKIICTERYEQLTAELHELNDKISKLLEEKEVLRKKLRNEHHKLTAEYFGDEKPISNKEKSEAQCKYLEIRWEIEKSEAILARSNIRPETRKKYEAIVEGQQKNMDECDAIMEAYNENENEFWDFMGRINKRFTRHF